MLLLQLALPALCSCYCSAIVSWQPSYPNSCPVEATTIILLGRLTNLLHRTHGAHRPFLPGLIRQNSPEAIKSTTKSVFSGIIAVDAVNVCPDAALSALTKPLKGVGPATATLLLAICAPDDILYFSDELYAWLVSPHQSSSTNKLKLKYDVKEYRCLFEAWLEFWHSSLSRGLRDVKAVDVEKAAYVLGHWDGLAPADKKKVFLEEAEISKGMGESKEEVRVIGAGITDEGKTRDDHADATAGGIRAAGRETSKRMAAAGESEKESPKKNQTAATSGHIKNNVPVEEGKRSVSEHDSMRRSKRLRRR